MFIILSQVHSTVKGPGADRSKPLPFSLSDGKARFGAGPERAFFGCFSITLPSW
jgi:hypothetical protein